MKTLVLLCLLFVTSLTAKAEDSYAAQMEKHIADLTKDPLKMAAFSCLGNMCGTLGPRESDYLDGQSKTLTVAGPQAIPALVYLVSDPISSPYLVGNVAEYAVKYPASDPLLAALRVRRDDKKFEQNFGWYLGVFKYFAAYGSRSDLAWMEATALRMNDSLRQDAAKSIQELRARLSPTITAPNKALQPTAGAATRKL